MEKMQEYLNDQEKKSEALMKGYKSMEYNVKSELPEAQKPMKEELKKKAKATAETRKTEGQAMRDEVIAITVRMTNITKPNGEVIETTFQVRRGFTMGKVMDEFHRAMGWERKRGDASNLSITYCGEEVFNFGKGQIRLKRTHKLNIRDGALLLLSRIGCNKGVPLDGVRVVANENEEGENDANESEASENDANGDEASESKEDAQSEEKENDEEV